MARGRHRSDNLNYWSEQHKGVLVWAARKALRTNPCPNIEIDDLVSVGWMGGLRRRPEDKLRGCSHYVYLQMLRHLRGEKKWQMDVFQDFNPSKPEYEREDPTDQFVTISLSEEMGLVLDVLNRQERFVIWRKYWCDESFAKIGVRMKVCGERVRQIHVSALQNLYLALVKRRTIDECAQDCR